MSLRQSILVLVGIVAIVIASCSILKSNDPDEAIRAFVVSFKTSLERPDAEILKQFDVQQSREAVLSAIHVLQNKESKYIQCTAAFQSLMITHEHDSIRVDIPITFSTINLQDENTTEESTLTFWVKEKQSGFVVCKLEGEKFYDTFSMIRSQVQWSADRQDALERRTAIYAKAHDLQKQYDSVVWYTTYLAKNYYYVINGSWKEKTSEEENTEGYKMGLVDDAGTVVVPVEYELVGTPGFIKPLWIEVTKAGKVGYFNMATRKLIVDPVYDMVLPYQTPDIYALVRTDSTYGWIDTQSSAYHSGFPTPEAESWVKQFAFIPKELTISGSDQALCEIPNEYGIGRGHVIPPSCYVTIGLFDKFVFGINSPDMPYGAETEFIKTTGTLFEKIADGITAITTHMRQRYVEGREEFYESNRVAFVSSSNQILATENIDAENVLHIKRLGENLVEIKSQSKLYWDYEGDETAEELDIPEYTYFVLDNTQVIKQKPERRMGFTQFAKIDSSYITGEFHYWNNDRSEQLERSVLSVYTLNYMYNEILASYGYEFKDSLNMARFDKYPRNTTDMDKIRSQFTEIDQHNVAFLEKIINQVKTEEKPIQKAI